MKRFGLIIIIGIGLLIASCGNKNNNSSKNQDVADVKKEVSTTSQTQKPVQRPKDQEPLKKGEKRVVVAKPKSSNEKTEKSSKDLTLDKAIKSFDKDVNAAQNCQELMTACRTFDSNVKKLSQKDKNITIASVEKRDDVRAIRKASEEKSLKMCQTQKMVK